MRRLLAVFVTSACLVAGLAWGQAPSVQSMPPSVVKTVPQSGDTSVDAATTKQIAVTFSKDMMDGTWSWAQLSAETFPKMERNATRAACRNRSMLRLTGAPSV